VDKIFGRVGEKVADREESGHVPQAVNMQEQPDVCAQQEGGLVPDIRKILYATDLSKTARHAARYACSIGHKFGADVIVMHVVPDKIEELSKGVGINLAEHIGQDEWDTFQKSSIDNAKIIIHGRIRETSRQVINEIPYCPLSEERIIVKVGKPAENIIAAAEENSVDLIIMGTHGHGKWGEAITGSITREVIRKSRIPVMTVSLPEEELTEDKILLQNRKGMAFGRIGK
jgi:nucleotide-binding universal stress UspA family protein